MTDGWIGGVARRGNLVRVLVFAENRDQAEARALEGLLRRRGLHGQAATAVREDAKVWTVTVTLKS